MEIDIAQWSNHNKLAISSMASGSAPSSSEAFSDCLQSPSPLSSAAVLSVSIGLSYKLSAVKIDK